MPKKSDRRRLLVLTLVLLTLGAAATAVRGRQLRAELLGPESGLAACDANDDLFTPDEDDAEAIGWHATFLSTVSEVVEAELENTEVSCEDNARAPASASLMELAKKLPQWKERAEGGEVFSSDVYEVMVDYLEAYGCALKAKGLVLPVDLLWAGQRAGNPLTFFESAQRTAAWFPLQHRQLAVARESVRRTLILLMGERKLEPLGNAFTCFNRSSKDLRNILGLLAEASACIPVRTWDARGTLRQFP